MNWKSVRGIVGVAALFIALFWISNMLIHRKTSSPQGAGSSDSTKPAKELSPRPELFDRARPVDPEAEEVQGVDPEVVMNNVMRTAFNEAEIVKWVAQGIITEEVAQILLGKEFDPSVLERNLTAIIELIGSSAGDRLLKRYAIAALGIYQDQRAYDALVGVVMTGEPWAKKASFYALSTWLPEKTTVTDLLMQELASDGPASLKYGAIEVLSEKRVPVPINQLVRVAQGVRGITAYLALNVLAEQSGSAALPYLHQIAETSESQGLREHAKSIIDQIDKGTFSATRGVDANRLTFKTTSGEETRESTMTRIDWPPQPPK